jgi:hypothetical protein
MATFLKLIFVICSVVLTAFIATLKLASPENSFNQIIVPFIQKNEPVRRLMKLNRLGDQRYYLTSAEEIQVVIEIDYPPTLAPHPDISLWLEKLIGETLDKQAVIYLDPPTHIIPSHPLTETEIYQLASELKTQRPSPAKPYLHIIYAASSATHPTNSGLAITDDTIIIFKSVIDALSDNNSVTARLEESTIKHEFGHLLGLEHLAQPDCIMSETVEVYQRKRYQKLNIPLEFCPETLFEIEWLKKQTRSTAPF